VGKSLDRVRAASANLARYLSQSEIEDLGVTATGYEDIGRLNVAMNDTFTVGRIQRVGDIDGDWKECLRFHGPSGYEVLQRHSVKEFHDHENIAFVVSNVVDRADVRMVKRRRGTSFAAKALHGLGIAGDVLRQKLQRDKTAQEGVFSLVHYAHAPTTELADDAVVRDRLVDHFGGVVRNE
jgi:hypothetical protein